MPKVFKAAKDMDSTAIITKSDWKNDIESAKVVGKMTAKMQKSLKK